LRRLLAGILPMATGQDKACRGMFSGLGWQMAVAYA
jgi:hypothetical protein